MYRRHVAAVVAALAAVASLVAPPAEAAAKRKPDVYIQLVGGPWVGRNEYFASTPFETTSELEVQGAGTYPVPVPHPQPGDVRDSFNILASRWKTPGVQADCGVTRSCVVGVEHRPRRIPPTPVSYVGSERRSPAGGQDDVQGRKISAGGR